MIKVIVCVLIIRIFRNCMSGWILRQTDLKVKIVLVYKITWKYLLRRYILGCQHTQLLGSDSLEVMKQ